MKTRLNELRSEFGYAPDYVSTYLGIPTETYLRYESDIENALIEIYISLSDLYGTSVSYIFFETDDPKPFPKRVTGD